MITFVLGLIVGAGYLTGRHRERHYHGQSTPIEYYGVIMFLGGLAGLLAGLLARNS